MKDHTYFFKRREALSQAFPEDVLIIPTGHEKVRANDTHFLFRPGSDFYYLTGNTEPDGVLVMYPHKNKHEHVLYVEPNPGRSNATFFTDRNKGELWVGPRMGLEASQAYFSTHRVASLHNLTSDLEKFRKTKHVRLLRGYSESLDSYFEFSSEKDTELAIHLSEMRLIKDRLELKHLQEACNATHRGFEDIIRALPEASSERVVEGIFYLRARLEGSNVGYNTIAACGEHACVLHWNRNDGNIDRKALLLIDAGVESNALYTADVTRTLPVSGKFSKVQRTLYELVLAAQEAGIQAVKPGNDFMEPNRAAMKVLAQGLIDLKILKMSLDEALDDRNMYYKRYTLHNVSHMLGLDVHDCAKARQESYKFGKLKPGMVLTVEPGLYFQPDDLTVPAAYRGIGIRIEDDVCVTKTGCTILSNTPKTVRDIERWMHNVWKSSKKRT